MYLAVKKAERETAVRTNKQKGSKKGYIIYHYYSYFTLCCNPQRGLCTSGSRPKNAPHNGIEWKKSPHQLQQTGQG